MRFPIGNGNEAAPGLWQVVLARRIVAPGGQRAICPESKIMIAAAGYGNHACCSEWHFELAGGAISPSQHGTHGKLRHKSGYTAVGITYNQAVASTVFATGRAQAKGA